MHRTPTHRNPATSPRPPTQNDPLQVTPASSCSLIKTPPKRATVRPTHDHAHAHTHTQLPAAPNCPPTRYRGGQIHHPPGQPARYSSDHSPTPLNSACVSLHPRTSAHYPQTFLLRCEPGRLSGLHAGDRSVGSVGNRWRHVCRIEAVRSPGLVASDRNEIEAGPIKLPCPRGVSASGQQDGLAGLLRVTFRVCALHATRDCEFSEVMTSSPRFKTNMG